MAGDSQDVQLEVRGQPGDPGYLKVVELGPKGHCQGPVPLGKLLVKADELLDG